MNHPGEIGYLTRIARPTVALVTNAQRAHLEGMGSLEAVAREKGSIYDGLAAMVSRWSMPTILRRGCGAA